MKRNIQLMTHVVVGYPTFERTRIMVDQMVRAGVEYIEMQIPFSDPVADGPTIMKANDRALKNGITRDDCFSCMKKMTQLYGNTTQFLFMCYYQTIFSFGVEQFCKQAHDCGAKGLIVPDLPYDEDSHENLQDMCQKYNLSFIRVISPNMSDERLEKNCSMAEHFLYCTSRVGTTGVTKSLDNSFLQFLRKTKTHTALPIAVGFGISKPQHVKALQGSADIAVIGSALIEQVERFGVQSVHSFLTDIRK